MTSITLPPLLQKRMHIYFVHHSHIRVMSMQLLCVCHSSVSMLNAISNTYAKVRLYTNCCWQVSLRILLTKWLHNASFTVYHALLQLSSIVFHSLISSLVAVVKMESSTCLYNSYPSTSEAALNFLANIGRNVATYLACPTLLATAVNCYNHSMHANHDSAFRVNSPMVPVRDIFSTKLYPHHQNFCGVLMDSYKMRRPYAQ